MIIDCHTHIHKIDAESESGGYKELSEAVDVSITLATPGESSDQANKDLRDYVAGHKDKMVGFAVVDPVKDKVGPKSISAVTEKLGLAGVVLYCSQSGFHPAHSRAMMFYESAQELNLPVFFHNSRSDRIKSGAVLDYAQSVLLDEIARTFPSLKIIVGNMGQPFIDQTLCLIAKHENVYADLTIDPAKPWQVYNIVVSAYEQGVMDKLLFGSNFPIGDAGQCIETLLGFNKLLGDAALPAVPRGEIKNIVERDTLEVLGLEH